MQTVVIAKLPKPPYRPSTGGIQLPEVEPVNLVGLTFLPTLAFGRVGPLLCLCYLRHRGPSDADWNVWLDRLRDTDFHALLISSPFEGGPNSKQRRLVAEYWKGSGRLPPRVARLTASPITRGAFTALSWLIPHLPMRAFGPAEIPEALAWLGSSVSPHAAKVLLFRLATGWPQGQRRAS